MKTFAVLLALALAPAASAGEVTSVDLTLPATELLDPVVVPVTFGKTTAAGSIPVVLRSEVKRRVQVFLLGCDACVADAATAKRYTPPGWIGTEVGPSTPYTGHLPAPSSGGRASVVVIDALVTRVGVDDVYGAPAGDAPATQRDLSRYALFARKGLAVRPTPHQVALVADAFVHLDGRFVVYARGPGKMCPLVAGEPVMVFSNPRETREVWRVLRANGETCFVPPDEHLGDLVDVKRPEKTTLPPIATANFESPVDQWQDEEFLADAADKKIAAYRTAKEKAAACAATEWKKHDPGGVAGYYDVVTYDAAGNVAKVEPFYDQILKKVDAACGLPALWKQRDAIRAKRTAAFAQQQKKLLDDVDAALRARP